MISPCRTPQYLKCLIFSPRSSMVAGASLFIGLLCQLRSQLDDALAVVMSALNGTVTSTEIQLTPPMRLAEPPRNNRSPFASVKFRPTALAVPSLAR